MKKKDELQGLRRQNETYRCGQYKIPRWICERKLDWFRLTDCNCVAAHTTRKNNTIAWQKWNKWRKLPELWTKLSRSRPKLDRKIKPYPRRVPSKKCRRHLVMWQNTPNKKYSQSTNQISKDEQPFSTTVRMNSRATNFIIDSGSKVTLIPKSKINDITPIRPMTEM